MLHELSLQSYVALEHKGQNQPRLIKSAWTATDEEQLFSVVYLQK